MLRIFNLDGCYLGVNLVVLGCGYCLDDKMVAQMDYLKKSELINILRVEMRHLIKLLDEGKPLEVGKEYVSALEGFREYNIEILKFASDDRLLDDLKRIKNGKLLNKERFEEIIKKMVFYSRRYREENASLFS